MLTLIFVILAAVIFEYSNGFHDAANAIATVVSTRVLTPRQAIAMAGIEPEQLLGSSTAGAAESAGLAVEAFERVRSRRARSVLVTTGASASASCALLFTLEGVTT